MFPIEDTTGEGLTTALLKEIEGTYGLDMKNCRVQDYDNGGNMTGKYKGVQSRMLSMFPKAFFNPCGYHSLNLVIGDAVASAVKKCFFVCSFMSVRPVFIIY